MKGAKPYTSSESLLSLFAGMGFTHELSSGVYTETPGARFSKIFFFTSSICSLVALPSLDLGGRAANTEEERAWR